LGARAEAARLTRESFAPDAAGSFDREVRELVAGARPLLREVVSLWPVDGRKRLVLGLRRDESGQPAVRARVHERNQRLPEGARDVRWARGEVPLVLELTGGRTAVVPWRSASA
jgi:hypothetical protein